MNATVEKDWREIASNAKKNEKQDGKRETKNTLK